MSGMEALSGTGGERLFQRRTEGQGVGGTQGAAQIFETVDKIRDFPAMIRPAGGGAEMGAATKRAILVDEASPGGRLEQGTGSIGRLGGRQLGAAGRAPGVSRDQRLRSGEIRRPSREFEAAAAGDRRTGPLDGALLEFAVNGADAFGDRTR